MYYMKGAPEKVFQQCTSYYKQGSIVPLVAKDWEMFSDAVAAMSSKGLRGYVLKGFIAVIFHRWSSLCTYRVVWRFVRIGRRGISRIT